MGGKETVKLDKSKPYLKALQQLWLLDSIILPIRKVPKVSGRTFISDKDDTYSVTSKNNLY